MTVGILIISHDSIGNTLFDTASMLIKKKPLPVKLVPVSPDSDPDKILSVSSSLLEELDHGDGVLILTDLLGSTPSNIAHRLQKVSNANIVTGINLSMLIRLFNYPDLNLAGLTEKAFSGGIDGITKTHGENEQ
jgi:mannose PTS system EIIA component